MIRASLIRVGKWLKGDVFTIDADLPLSAVLSFGIERSIGLMRGLWYFPWLAHGSRFPIFVSAGARLRTRRKIIIGRGATIGSKVLIQGLARKGVQIGEGATIGSHTIIMPTSVLRNLGEGFSIGKNSGIGQYGFIGCGGGVSIGENVIMGQFVSFHTENHLFDKVEEPIISQGVTRKPIVIEDDVWVGVKVTFLSGARVGRGSIVAAGAVVRGNFPPNTILGGVPAKVIGMRT